MSVQSGRYDCKRHIESKQHKDFIKLKQSSRSIANYCVENQTKTNLDMQIVKAKLCTKFFVCFSLSFKAIEDV